MKVVSAAESDKYQVIGTVSGHAVVENFDILGLIHSGDLSTSDAEEMAIESGLIVEAKKMGADAITDIQIVSAANYDGCAVIFPISYGAVIVHATALKRK